MNILLTGGAGYIGSHTYCELIDEGHNVIIFDNFSNSEKSVLKRLELITKKPINYAEGDILDSSLLKKTLTRYQVEAVIHFAGLKAAGESVKDPLSYYENNVVGSINLLKSMEALQVRKFVFSSSATVYGTPQYLPIDEEHVLDPINPYGRTKLQIETILKDISSSNPAMRITILRYFNPVGAHPSGLIGESPLGVPNNLVPYMLEVANHKLPFLKVYGDDYKTPDGSGIRDYIHVTDLALGHIKALNFLNFTQAPFHIFNLGTGKGSSVFEVIQTFNKTCGVNIPFEIEGKRVGDVASCYAENQKAKKVLNWQPIFSLEDMIKSSWEFQQKRKYYEY